ncbi:steroid hormone receptor ERR1-like isoform X3 [Daphnia pulex]|uniref:steroid hormone receptor ERR1-like isoform X3 n=1 Tax=Daphnia pulex TaxID=6669 RepID=UPI001EE0F274|nr:steroid hormone receptor ERR1-like isoform X3 [Daphnia pulex]
MESWAEALAMMTTTEPLLLRSEVKKEESDLHHHHHHHMCGMEDCSPADSSLYSPTTTGLQLEEPSLAAEETDISTDISPLSTGLCRSISRSYSSPEPDDGADLDGKQQQYVHCSSTTAPAADEFPNRHRTAQSDNFKDEDAPKRLCLVCGDVASGFHYGVASCEACKAFFKRTIQGNIEYTCPASNDCEINKRRRKACQACRFQKCIRMGMLKEGVRLDRVRGGRQKYRRVTPYTTTPASANNNAGTQAGSTDSNNVNPQPVKKVSLEDNKILNTLGQCEPEMLTTVDILWPEGDASSMDPSLRILCTLSELYDRELVAAIGWAKQIPGFLEMPLNDQMRLLQTSWPEVLTLSLAFRSIPLNSSNPKLQWSADFGMNEKEARECGMEELFFQCVQIAQRLEQLSVTREEYYLLKALVLVNCDVRVESMAHVKKLRETVLAALSDCSAALRQGSGASQQMQHLLLCMPCIRQVDSSLRRFWALVRRDSRVPMNKLFLEMLESPLR